MDTQEKQIVTVEIDDVLSGESSKATKKVTLVADEDGNPAVGFVIVGKDSDQYRECAARLRSNAIRRQSNKRSKIDTKTDEGAHALARILDENEFELAASVVVDYFGLTQGGVRVECSDEMTRKLFKAKPSWREKVSAELEAEDGFLKLSSANSAISRAVNSVSDE